MLYMLFIDHIDVILLEGIKSKFTLLDSKNYQFLCNKQLICFFVYKLLKAKRKLGPISFMPLFLSVKITARPYFQNLIALFNPASVYLLKVNNRNTRTRCEICSKLTIMTLFWCLHC